MSMKKNALAVALVAGLSLAGAAAAYTIQTNNDDVPERVATADITSNSTVITMTQAVNVKVDNLDNIVARTTGFNVRVELSAGVFNANPTVNPGANLPAGWTVVLAAGGANNTYAVFAVQPPSTSPVPGIQPGEIFNLSNVQLRGLSSLQTSGNSITGVARFIDPVGASEIGSDTTVLLQSGNPVQLGCDPTSGDADIRIDVGQQEGGQGSKTYFSSTGEIGMLDADTADLGDVVVTRDASFSSFAYTGTDAFTTVVTGDFSAFDVGSNSLYLSDDNCASSIGAAADIDTATNTATFEYTAADAGFGASGGRLSLCAQVASGNATVIDSTNVSVRTTFERAGVPAVTGAACSLLPLQYNGSVVRVYNVNPAGNSTAQSFVRVINQSETSGRVSIVGIDDNGLQRGPVAFNLGALKSMQINSEDLENGNAAKGLTGSLGDGAGKWRLFVTGEFSGMVVQSLNRNATDGTVTNLTDADTRGEQVLNDLFEGGGAP